SYAYQLAKDIGGAASITDVFRLSLRTRRGWRLPYVWAGGASFNSKFRMVGPWRSDGAPEILTGELWETIRRREGLFGNVPLSILPMMYLGSVNIYYYMYSAFWGALAKIGLYRPLVPRNAVKEVFEELARREQQMRLQAGAADTKATPAEIV